MTMMRALALWIAQNVGLDPEAVVLDNPANMAADGRGAVLGYKHQGEDGSIADDIEDYDIYLWAYSGGEVTVWQEELARMERALRTALDGAARTVGPWSHLTGERIESDERQNGVGPWALHATANAGGY